MSASINTSPSNLKQLKKKLRKFWEKTGKYKTGETKKWMPSGISIRNKKKLKGQDIKSVSRDSIQRI
jgi:hypothetical protein